MMPSQLTIHVKRESFVCVYLCETNYNSALHLFAHPFRKLVPYLPLFFPAMDVTP